MDIKDGGAKKDITPDIPGLKAMESGDSHNNESTDKNTTKSINNDMANSSRALGNIENGGASFGYNAAEIPSGPMGRALDFAKTRRGKVAFGGAAMGLASLVLLFIFGIAGLGSFTLITIEKDLMGYESRVEQHAQNKAAKKILSKLVCRGLNGNPAAANVAGCGSNPENKPGQDEAAQEAEVKDANGSSLTAEEDKFDFTKPEVVDSLAAQGINVEMTADGKFNGLTDSSGNPITIEDIQTNTDIFSKFETALPEWNIGQIQSFEPIESLHAQADFAGVGDNAGDNVDKEVVNEITEGAPDAQIAELVNQTSDNSVTEQPSKTVSATEIAQDTQAVGDNSAALTAVDKSIANGASETQAEAAGVKAFNLGDPIMVSTILSDACSIKQAADNGAKNRVPEILKLAIRHIGLLLSIADQIKSGHITASAVSSVMTLLQGDPSALSTLKNPAHNGKTEVNQASLPWNRSAAWMRASGNASAVDTNPDSSNYTPDLANTSLPTANAGTVIDQLINNITDKVGGNQICTIENSLIGTIGNFFANSVQLVSGELDFGLSDLAVGAGVVSFQLFLQHDIIPQIVRYFTPVGMYGKEFSTQWMNVSDMGANVANNDYFRSLGAEPVSNPTAQTQYALANQAQQQYEASQPLTYRVFALSNPNSLITKLALDLPLTKFGALTDITSYFTNIAHNFASMFSTILTPKSLFADSPTSPSQNPTPGIAYGLTQYGFSDSAVTAYDSIANEQYLNTSVTYQGKSYKRLTMLGDPMLYPPGIVDPSTTDILHCFTQGFDVGNNPTASEASVDPICGSEGNYDINSIPPTPITDSNVAISYCDYITGGASQSCLNIIEPQLDNDIGHFRQYLMDVSVMNNYAALDNVNLTTGSGS